MQNCVKNEKKLIFVDFFTIFANNIAMKKFFAFAIMLLISITAPYFHTQNYSLLHAETQTCEVPIIMYHSLLKSKQSQYITSPDNFKRDLQKLKDLGYQSVFVQDLINYCKGKADLPKKPVVISFDDGHYNNYTYAYPILKEMGFKANLNVVGCYCEFSTTSGDCDNPNYSYLTWQEIKQLQNSGVFEIGNHTYSMHKYSPRFGISKLACEDEAAYKESLTKDVLRLEDKFKNECGFSTNVFAYPFGKYEKNSGEILSQLGFEAFLTCNEGINKLTKGDAKSLSLLKRINRTGTLSTEEIFRQNKIN